MLHVAAFVAFLALGASPAPGRGPGGDVLGERFWCAAGAARTPCLKLLVPPCRLEFVAGQGIPAEAENRVMIARADGPARRVAGPADLAGCVRIESGDDALEYLRFFSSYDTVHLFATKTLEVFPGAPGGEGDLTRLPSKTWRRLRLRPPVVRVIRDGFSVERFVIRPDPEPWKVALVRVVEHVGRDGAVRVEAEQRIRTGPRDLIGLTFPMYL